MTTKATVIEIALLLTTSLVASSVGCGPGIFDEDALHGDDDDDVPPSDCEVFEGPGCYWMENLSGNYCWVPAPQGDVDFDRCMALDACGEGGGGQSGGGCYKWSDGSDSPRVPW